MAEDNAAKENDAGSASANASAQKPTLFIILLVLNMLVIGGLGAMIYMDKQKQAAKEGALDKIVEGEQQTQAEESKSQEFIGKLVPLETFVLNLSGVRGRKIVKISMELEVSNEEVQLEIDKLKPKIRDMIILIISGKSYSQVSEQEGKEGLREEIKDKVNLFLTKGHIKNVFFTEFIYN